jgi:hypothetical protein
VSTCAELAGGVSVFFFSGFGLEHWLDTAAWFMVGMTVAGLLGSLIRAYYGYKFEMDQLDAERRGTRAPIADSEQRS